MAKSRRWQLPVRMLAGLLALALIASVLPVHTLRATAASGPEAFEITVVNAETGDPIKDAQVFIDEATEPLTTDNDGKVVVSLDEENIWFDYRVTALGYKDKEGTADIEDPWELKVEMTPLATLTATGLVLDAETGDPLEGAKIVASGYGPDIQGTTDSTGSFSISVYEGKTYQVRAEIAGYKTGTKNLNSGNGMDPMEFRLEVKSADPIAFEQAEYTVAYGQTIQVLAKGELGSATEYAVEDTTIAEVDDSGNVTPKGLGTTTVTAKRAENDQAKESTASCTLTVNQGTQDELTWSVSVPESIAWNETFANPAVGGSGDGEITYSSSNEDVATVDNSGTVTMYRIGDVTISAVKSGNGLYEDVSAEPYTLHVVKAQQEPLVFEKEGPVTLDFGATLTNAATGGSATENPIRYESSNPGVATVGESTGAITTVSAGKTTITAKRAGNESRYEDVEASYELIVTPIDAPDDGSFYFAEAPDTSGKITVPYSTAPYANPALGAANVTYSSSDPAVAEVDENGSVTLHKAGQTTISATKPAAGGYNAQTISYLLVVEKAAQEISFAKQGDEIPVLGYQQTFRNPVTGAQGTVTYESSDESLATVASDGTVTALKGTGTVTIRAWADATDCYAETGKISYQITLGKANQTVTFGKGDKPTVRFNQDGNIFTNVASTNADPAGKDGITFTYALVSGNAELTSAASGRLRITGATNGTPIVVKATASGNENYEPGEATYELTVEKAEQTIAFVEPGPFQIISGDPFTEPTVQTVGQGGTGAVTYSFASNDANIATIDAATGKLTFTDEEGTATVRATKAADDNYAEATATYQITVVAAQFEGGYAVTGPKLNDSGWYTGEVRVVFDQGYSYRIAYTMDWKTDPIVFTDNGENSESFKVMRPDGHKSGWKNVAVKIDTVAPELTISAKNVSNWDSFLTIVTLGKWNAGEKVITVKAEDKDPDGDSGWYSDASGIKSTGYYIDRGNAEFKTGDEQKAFLQTVTWTEYQQAFSVPANEKCVVYARTEDVAGHVTYASTNGIIFDQTAPEVTITPVTAAAVKGEDGEADLYTGDVTLDVGVTDLPDNAYSGLKKVSYEILMNGVVGESGELFAFGTENPKYENLRETWPGEDETERSASRITIDSSKFCSENLILRVYAEDNAGYSDTKDFPLRVSAKGPSLAIEFLNDPTPVMTAEDGISYYDAQRKARITITGRYSLFDPANVILTGLPENEDTYTLGDWSFEKGATEDEDRITAEITFKGSARYDLGIAYKDKADRSAEFVTVPSFVVDGDEPTGSVTVHETTWENWLFDTLTFHLWSNEDRVEVSAEYGDPTSPIHAPRYCIVGADGVKPEADDPAWAEYTGPVWVDADKQFVVYLEVTDYAGHVKYFSSDGYILEQTPAAVALTPDEPDTEFGYYNDDFDVAISVTDQPEETDVYSGIQKIEYWIEAGPTGGTRNETVRKTLYEFVYEGEANAETGKLTVTDWATGEEKKQERENVALTQELLKKTWEGSVTVDAEANSFGDVRLFVEVTDLAGNVSRYTTEINGETADYLPLKINTKAPVITLSFDNNAFISQEGERGYYNAPRTATLEILDRSFYEENFKENLVITANNNAGDIALNLNDLLTFVKTEQDGDDITHVYQIAFAQEANYEFTLSYTNQAGKSVAYEDVVLAEGTKTPRAFTVDQTAPTAEVLVNANKWTELLSALTFGLYDQERFDVTAAAEDAVSPLTLEYYISNKDAAIDPAKVAEDQWKVYDGAVPVTGDQRFAVYVRATDAAGNRCFISSDGHVIDGQKSSLDVKLAGTVKNNIYSSDITVTVNADERVNGAKQYSGIQSVEYWVTNGGTETQHEKLYDAQYERDTGDNSNGGKLTVTADGRDPEVQEGHVPAAKDLKMNYAGSFIIDADKNNSSSVHLKVQVVDNAGNVQVYEQDLDIDVTAPTIDVDYGGDNGSLHRVEGDRGYFPVARTATVTITERANHFEELVATGGITITAVDVKGKEVLTKDQIAAMISGWTHSGNKNLDTDRHVATIRYTSDANYTFRITYTDKAGNKCGEVNTGSSATPFNFTVDKTAPTGTVTTMEKTWEKLLETLTFGLFSRTSISVACTGDDVTSPYEPLVYYLTDSNTALTAADLDKVSEENWKSYPGSAFSLAPNERVTVYLRVVDYAGNVTYVSTDGIILDDTLPVVESVSPRVTVSPAQPVNGFYNTDVPIRVLVEDPVMNGSYSGIKSITYEVRSLGVVTQQGELYNYGSAVAGKQGDLLQQWENAGAIVVDRNRNNSNEVEILVKAVDNAGNEGQASTTIKIDVTAPTISVSYDNNDGDTAFADGTTGAFFKANRTATIVVTERNFDPAQVQLTLTNTDGVVPTLSGWSTEAAGGNGDGTRHIATLTYAADGDYRFDIACSDQAGNRNTDVTYNGLAPQSFTIDKTLPVINVSYDPADSAAQNGNYFNTQRTATVTITEHNFETSRIVVTMDGKENGASVALPTVNGWTSSGDTHTATIVYDADAHYTFTISYQDKAGNAAETYPEDAFVVDKTPPVVELKGIADQSANSGSAPIGFVLTATDNNFDVFEPVVTGRFYRDGAFVTETITLGEIRDIPNGKEFVVENLPEDGIYTVTCTVVDKAGNAYETVTLYNEDGTPYTVDRTAADSLVDFSVNRLGSAYDIDEATADLVERYYVQKIFDDVVLLEVNADEVEEHTITLNGKTLTEGQDYTVSVEEGEGGWMKYTYRVNRDLFTGEGQYDLVLTSKDKANNETFSDVKGASVRFVVDYTAPVVTVSGLESNGRYQTDRQLVTLIPTDDGGALRSLKVLLVDEKGETIKTLVDLEDEEFEKALKDGDGKITFELEEGLFQNVRIICDDWAYYGDEENVIYDETFTDVSVSSNALMIFWANKPLRWGTIGGAGGLGFAGILLALLKKRKKKEETVK